MKRVVKKILQVVGFVFLALILLLVVFVLYLRWKGNQPLVFEGYANVYQTQAELERQYLAQGPHTVTKLVFPAPDTRSQQYHIWLPESAQANMSLPAVVIVNASDLSAPRYEPFFAHLASWGFVVIGNEDRQTGTGESSSEMLDVLLAENECADSPLFSKIDTARIGIAGFSQGGAGAINGVAAQENGHLYKTIFTGSAANSQLSQAIGWEYDASKIKIPWFMTAGTLKNDTGEDGGIGVAPLSSLVENCDAVTAPVLKVRARAVGADHEDMLIRSDGYLVAWMRFQLCGDEQAAAAFTGTAPEIANNEYWQDVAILE